MRKSSSFLQQALVALIIGGCGDTDSAPITSNIAADADVKSETKSSAGRGGSSGGSAQSERTRAQDAGAAPKADKAANQDELPIKLRFLAQLGDEPFACSRSYADQGSTKQTVTPRDLRMFIQDVALVDDAGREVPVKLDTRDPWQTPEVALLDFEDASGECFGTADTNTQITGVVPKGSYSALRFSNGVPEQLNHSDPKSFPAPLMTPGMSWNWLLGLRFMRLEMGSATRSHDSEDAGADVGSFALHIGSTACSGNQNAGTIRCTKQNRSRIELKDFDVDKSEVVFDVSKLLAGNDLSQLIECHAATPVCEPMFKALGVSYASGESEKEQTAFRLK